MYRAGIAQKGLDLKLVSGILLPISRTPSLSGPGVSREKKSKAGHRTSSSLGGRRVLVCFCVIIHTSVCSVCVLVTNFYSCSRFSFRATSFAQKESPSIIIAIPAPYPMEITKKYFSRFKEPLQPMPSLVAAQKKLRTWNQIMKDSESVSPLPKR